MGSSHGAFEDYLDVSLGGKLRQTEVEFSLLKLGLQIWDSLVKDTVHVVMDAKQHLLLCCTHSYFSQRNSYDIFLVDDVADQELGGWGKQYLLLSKLRKHVKLSPADGVDMEDHVRVREIVWRFKTLAVLDLKCGRISVPLDQVANFEQVCIEFFVVKNIVLNAVSYIYIKVAEGSVNVSHQALHILQLLL